ncbi:hypothetical protein Bbelb_196020 [Branchiostoma belcheri]|nr:hypothetical protein Bbelb_196020 [Branchiostoma belcheri]
MTSHDGFTFKDAGLMERIVGLPLTRVLKAYSLQLTPRMNTVPVERALFRTPLTIKTPPCHFLRRDTTLVSYVEKKLARGYVGLSGDWSVQMFDGVTSVWSPHVWSGFYVVGDEDKRRMPRGTRTPTNYQSDTIPRQNLFGQYFVMRETVSHLSPPVRVRPPVALTMYLKCS